MVYLYITLMVILFLPAFYVNVQPFEDGTMAGLVWGVSLFALGSASASIFYVASQKAQRRGALETVIQLPLLMSIGIGIALNNARGCIEALFGHESPFVRTPKYNTTKPMAELGNDGRRRKKSGFVMPTPSIKLWMSLLEILFGVYMLWCVWLSLMLRHTSTKHSIISTPFLLLFAAGYLYVGLSSLWSQWASRRASKVLVAPAS
jgi:hypothetical protein